jgi:hypothetical protein
VWGWFTVTSQQLPVIIKQLSNRHKTVCFKKTCSKSSLRRIKIEHYFGTSMANVGVHDSSIFNLKFKP